MSLYLFLFMVGLVTSVTAIVLGIMFSRYLKIADHPGDHKQHQVSTPFVGGLGVIGALLAVLKIAYHREIMSSAEALVIATGALAIFVTGFIDDIWRLNYKIRFLIQGLTACLMVYGGGVVLADLGQLVPGVTMELGWLAPFFTIFATLGVINAINMIDGIDGLSGSITLVSLLLLAVVTLLAGQHNDLILIIALTSGVIGFLGFNLRCFGRCRALVFLGDNGSMLLGFLLAWLFIGLSQGQTPAMTPVTALWLFAVPLIDTMTVMIRRLWLRKSPFHPDRFHLHHLLLRAGFKTSDAVLVIVLLHGLFGVIGLTGLYLGVWEVLMFVGFLGIFCGYLYVASRPWRCIPALRRLHHGLGLMKADCQGVFIGYFDLEAASRVVRTLQQEMTLEDEYDLRIYQFHTDSADPGLYVVLEAELAEESRSESDLGQLVSRLKKYFSADGDIKVRQYVRRDPANDRRVGQKPLSQDLRRTDRRNACDRILYQTDYFLNRSLSCDVHFVDEGKQPSTETLAAKTE
jgi:undecaprenyl-phosphate alpha-N-acetylglucosaminyl 1-phosphatetransferase